MIENIQANKPKPLNLSLPKIVLDNTNIELTENGTVIFDRKLLKQLKVKQQKKRIQKEYSYNRMQSTASGWANKVKIGEKCFNVIEIDPLDSLSEERWFRTKC